MPRTWSSVLARTGVRTGDGRILMEGGGTSRDLPQPLMYQQQTGDGHGGAVVVGRIEAMRFENGMVTATGSMLGSAPYEVLESLEAGVIGPSVDLDDIEYVMDDAENLVLTRWRVAGATLVAVPAFADVSLTLDPMPVTQMYEGPYGLTAAVRSSGWGDMPITSEGRSWDGVGAAKRVFAWATDGDVTDWTKYSRAFVQKKDGVDPQTKGAYGYGIADVIDGTLTIVPRGVFAAAAAVQGSRGATPGPDAEGIRRVLSGIYRRMDRVPPWDTEQASASLAAFAAETRKRMARTEVLPPAEWFRAPDVDRVTPLTVSDTGRVFGHIAPWGECHVGLPGCVTAPSSQTEYAHFHVGAQQVQGGGSVPVGTLVTGPRHADPQAAFRAAQQHYDDLDAAVARVVAGEDEFGIWVAGWMLPEASPVRVEQFMSSPVSGDWRRIGGSLEMIAVCSVNAPGFPVARARVAFSNGAQTSLIGSFGIKAQKGEFDDVDTAAAPLEAHAEPEALTMARAKWAKAEWDRKVA